MRERDYWGVMQDKPTNSFGFVEQKNPMIYEMKLSSVIKDRRIWICDDVDDNSMFEALFMLQKLERIDKVSGMKPTIEIMVNTYGGVITSGLALCSKMAEMIENGYEIITTNLRSYSMGAMILIMGTKRQSYRYGDIMFHELLGGTGGNLTMMNRDLDQSNRTMKKLIDIIEEKTDIPREKMEKIGTFNWFLEPDEALKYGVIDVIL